MIKGPDDKGTDLNGTNAGFNANGQLAPAPGQVPAIPSTNPQTFTTPTGAFPNQLAGIAIRPGLGPAYVVSTGDSPNGPLRFNHMAQGLVSVFNTDTRTEITSGQTGATVRQEAPLNLNRGINLSTTPAPRLFLTNPVAMAWRPDGSDAWVVIQNSNLLVRLTVDAAGIPTIAAPLVAGPSSIVRVDLQTPGAGLIPGKAPRGVAINGAGTRAFVYNFVSRSVTAVNIANPTAPTIIGTTQASPQPAPGTNHDFELNTRGVFGGRGLIDDPNQRAALAGHNSWIFDLAITNDGQTLISAGGDDSLIGGLRTLTRRRRSARCARAMGGFAQWRSARMARWSQAAAMTARCASGR